MPVPLARLIGARRSGSDGALHLVSDAPKPGRRSTALRAKPLNGLHDGSGPLLER